MAHSVLDIEYGRYAALPALGGGPPNIPDQFGDGSETLFSMYLDRALEEDKDMVERWKNTTDGLLVFIGLFSTVVAAFIAISVLNIQRNPQDTSSFYLAHIYQQLSTLPNGSQPSIPSTLTNPIEQFIPPTLAVWASGLWFLSLVISLTCALVAISLQQWARQYLQVAHSHRNPYKRACLRSFYKYGVDELHIPLNIEWVPMLLHISLFLFFAGISVYLFDVHRTIFKVVTAWIGLCVISYAYLTILPIIHKNTPCSSPFSSFIFICLASIRYIFHLLWRFTRTIRFHLQPRRDRPLRGPDPTAVQFHRVKAVEQYALELELKSNHSKLWRFWKFKDDSDLEEFFVRFTRLRWSEKWSEREVYQNFIETNKEKLSICLKGLIDRTVKLSPIYATVKHRRMIMFTEIIRSRSFPLLDPSLVLRDVLFKDWHPLLEYIEFGLLMKDCADASYSGQVTVSSFYAQCAVTLSLSTTRTRDERWLQVFTSNIEPLSISLDPNEACHSILLAHAICFVRMSVQTYSGSGENDRGNILDVSQRTLREVCKLDIQKALPELQHEFCDLWNKLVITAQTDELRHRTIAMKMLKNIRKLYIALHSTQPLTESQTVFNITADWEQILDNSEFYPQCMERDHRHIHTFPDLQFNARPSQPVTSAQPTAATSNSPRFPEPYIPAHNILSNPFSLPGQTSTIFPDAHFLVPYAPTPGSPPPPPGFSNARSYIPPLAQAGNSSSPHSPT